MDPETIQKLAAEIATHLPSYSWGILAIQVLLTLAAAGAGAFLGEYLKTRGKNLATRTDLDSLQDQLRANTELVETIKAEVGQKDWAKREWQTLRRTKLEQLLNKKYECNAFLLRMQMSVSEGKAFKEPDPHAEIGTIATLYLPELKDEAYAYLALFSEHAEVNHTSLSERLSITLINISATKEVTEKYIARVKSFWPEFLVASGTLDAAAARLLRVIMDVAEEE